jgi:predicted metal-dependent peptidase
MTLEFNKKLHRKKTMLHYKLAGKNKLIAGVLVNMHHVVNAATMRASIYELTL